MFVNTSFEIISYSDIHDPVVPVSEKVDVVCAIFGYRISRFARNDYTETFATRSRSLTSFGMTTASRGRHFTPYFVNISSMKPL
jgi:hypothetical protein